MNKVKLILTSAVVCAAFTACNESADANKTTDSTSTTTTMNDTGMASATPMPETAPPVAKGPVGPEDSTFMMKAAAGGMMEVKAGELAQANAANERIKAFASQMVTDHTKANNELMAYASEHGVALPASLPPDMQKHIDAMQKMTGKAFDKHYMDMMVTDHKKTIALFEKEANAGKEADLKAWAEKTLPTLKMHGDSAMAINKAKM